MVKRILFSVLLLTVILSSIACVFAVEVEDIRVNYTLEYDGVLGKKTLANGNTLKGVKAGDKVTFTAACSDSRATYWSQNTNFMSKKGYTFNRDGMAFVGYMFDSKNPSDYIVDYSKPTTVTITIPNFDKGSTHILRMEGVAACDGLTEDGKELEAVTGTVAIQLIMQEEEVPQESITLTLTKGTDKATAKATVTNGTFDKFLYNWDGAADKELTKNPSDISYPTEVGKHTLTVQAVSKSGLKSSKKTITYEVAEPESISLTLTKGTDKATAKATVTNGTFDKFLYNWDGAANKELTKNPSDISYPTEVGKHTLTVQAVSKSGLKSSKKTITYEVKGPDALTGEVSATIDGKPISEDKSNPTTFEEGKGISVTYSPKENFSKVEYSWDDGAFNLIPVTIPTLTPGVHKLTIKGTLTDGSVVTKVYYINIPNKEDPTPDPLTGTVLAKFDGKTLKSGSTTKVDVSGVEVVISGSPEDNFTKLVYSIDDGAEKDGAAKGTTLKIPLEANETKKLKVRGLLKDGGVTSENTYYFVWTYEEEEDELILEPWMIENEDAEGLIVSLRNSSDVNKDNCNYYMLDEEVIYYVDYMNAGKDIKDEVKLVLNIPLKFTAVNAKGAIVDEEKKTFTWTFKDGLKEGQCGTKEVILKYTALSRRSLDSEMIYPQAVIYKKTKAEDYSAVINCIYKDEDTEIDAVHNPYMIGDREKPTFRPDDGISRAEGALVLMRIFEVNYQNAKITTKFSDIDQTYEIAQRAISKATELGVIQGYTDGTYRPNEKMTRAEFMKIIAAYVEVIGDDENVKGLEVKDEDAIWLYKNSSKKNHWAISYVTLLSRLNMTSVRKDKNLRLDDIITRAEVAQLCNYYLFRAPVKVTSSTKTGFTDVSRNHKLFADIVEATRESHDVLVNVDGKEIGK